MAEGVHQLALPGEDRAFLGAAEAAEVFEVGVPHADGDDLDPLAPGPRRLLDRRAGGVGIAVGQQDDVAGPIEAVEPVPGELQGAAEVGGPIRLQAVDGGADLPGVVGRLGLEGDLVGERDQADLGVGEVALVEERPGRLLASSSGWPAMLAETSIRR